MRTLFAIVMISFLTACGTVAGLGSDIQKSAQWTQDKMSGSAK